jgi:gliotoxin/aspirochlorine/mycotoxins biosynthesis cytochrome P450 monooxygenase
MKALSNDSGYLMGEILGSCVGLISGVAWDVVRKAFQGSFMKNHTLQSTMTILNEVETYITAVRSSKNLRQWSINPAQELKMLPFFIIAKFLYGPLSNEAIEELISLAGLREKLFVYVMKGGISRFYWSKYLPLKANSLFAQFKSRWQDVNDRNIAELQRLDKVTPITQIWAGVKEGGMTENQFYQTVDEILFASLDVTTGEAVMEFDMSSCASRLPKETTQ